MHKRIQKAQDQITTIEQIEQQLLQVNGFTPSAIISVAGNRPSGADHHHDKRSKGDRGSLSINTSNSQNATISHGGPSSIRGGSGAYIGQVAIQGRRVDSPELKMAVNREFIMAEQGRPHTSGMPFLNGGIIYRQQYEVKDHIPPQQTASLRTRQTHDEGSKSGRQYVGRSSKSQHPNQKRKKNQTSRSTPKGYTSIVNTNIQAQIVNTTAQQIFNININNAKPASATQKAPTAFQQNASSSVPQTTTNSQQINNLIQRKRFDSNKFHSLGGQGSSTGVPNSGVMSAPNKSKSRSRSLRRRQEPQSLRAAAVSSSISQQSKVVGGSRPPRQPQNLLNRSNINYNQKNTTLDITGPGGPVDVGISFEHHKGNDETLNLNEFSPSRITNPLNKNQKRANGFLDSDSSLSSPKPQNNNHNLLHALEAASSGPQTGKSKSAFMKHFSPDRDSTDFYVGGQALSSSGQHSREVSGSQKMHLDSKALAAAHHRVNLSIVDKMMKDRFKEMKAREEAEQLSRRKIQNDNLIKKQKGIKCNDTNSHRANRDGLAKRLNLKQHKPQDSNATASAHLKDQKYKKQRSKSCMNQTEDIFGGAGHQTKTKYTNKKHHKNIHPQNIGLRKVFNAQAQQELHNLQDQDQTIIKEDKVEVQPKQPTQQTKKKEKSTVLQIKELNKQCMEEIKKEFLAGKIEGFLPFSQSAFASNKRQANLVTVQQKDSKISQSANTCTNQLSKGDLNNGNTTEEPKRRTNSKGREVPTHNASMISKSLHLNPQVITKVKKFLETKKKQGTKTMEQTAEIEKKLRIQNNLEQLNQKIKHHNKGTISLGLMAKRQQLPDPDTSCLSVGHVNSSGNTTSININIHNPQVPDKNLKAQIHPEKKKAPGVFNYKNELYDHSEGKFNSSSFTPEGGSRRAFVPVDIDISLEMQQDCKKLLNDISKRHQLSHPDTQCNNDHHHSHHISKSNPPVINRKIQNNVNTSGQAANSFSFDVSSIGAGHQRDSSHKNDRRRGVAKPLNEEKPQRSTKKSPPQRMEEQRSHIQKRDSHQQMQKNRTLHHQKAAAMGEDNHPVPKSNNKDRRSNSSPNTLVADLPIENGMTSIIQSTSDVNTNNQRDLHSANLIRGLRGSDQGSNSNNASSTLQELQSKIKVLAHQYGPHIKDLMNQKKGLKGIGRVSKTQMLITLHSAAIVIQQYFRKYLARKGFYMNSLTYLNTSEDDGYLDNKDRTLDDASRVEPDRVLTANISPLRTKAKTMKKDPAILNVPQFYSSNSSVNDKVVQFSVISSGRPDPSNLPLSGEGSNNQSFNCTVNYNHLRNKTQLTISDPAQSAPITQPPSGFTTALKNPQGISMIEEESKSVQECTSPSQHNTNNQGNLNESSSKGDGIGGQSSSSRRNPVPLLNLSSLGGIEKHPVIHLPEERKHESTVGPKTLFERHSFQDLKESNPHLMEQFNLQNFPEMLHIREEIIKKKEETEKHLLKQQLKAEELTPRTYKSKKLELEKWVTKEKEEVKKSRKRFEEEFQKTQHMINEIQRNQEVMKKLIIDPPGASTHRSRGDLVNGGEHSYRVRADSHRIHSSRPGQSFLDALEGEQKGEPHSGDSSSNKVPLELDDPYRIAHANTVKASGSNINQFAQLQSESSQKSIPEIQKPDEKRLLDLKIKITEEEVKLNYVLDEDNQFISNAFLNSRPTGGKIKVVDGDSQQDTSERKNLADDDSNFNSREGSDQDGANATFKKGLSRTKGSLQLPQMNNADDEVGPNPNGTMGREHMYLITTTNNLGSLGEDVGLSSDFKKNICDTSQDEVDVQDQGANSPEDLKDKLKDQNFFIKDFDSGNVQAIVERAQSHNSHSKRSTPSNELNNSLGDHQIRSPSQQDINDKSIKSDDGVQRDRPPMPPSPSPDHHRLADHRDHQPHSLEDIDIQMPPEQLNIGPVSPVSNPDMIVGNIGDTKIITGGGSLNSTLSVGEGGNLDLVKVIKEITQEEILKSTSPPAGSPANDLDEPLVPQSKLDDNIVQKITDDIFQNLIGELKLDLEVLLLNDPRTKKPQQAPSLGDSGRFPIFDRRGIQTDLFAIERYVEEVLQEVMTDKDKFMHNVMNPISKNAQEVLNQLQNSEIGSYDHFEQHYPAVLPLETYLKLERRRKDHRMQEQAENKESGDTRNFLAECEHIHNKVLFDCINDSLLQFKPYAKDGEPLPWSRQNRRLKPIEDFTIEEMFEIVKHDLFRWAIMQAGTLPRREFVFGGLFDEELFAEIREKKLATLLAREMIENEPRWLNYEFEEAQVKIDIGDMILEQLVTETISILNTQMGGPTSLQQPPQSEINTSTFSSRMIL